MPSAAKRNPQKGTQIPLMLDAHTQTSETRVKASDNPRSWSRRERDGLTLFKCRRGSSSRSRDRSGSRRRRPRTPSSSRSSAESPPKRHRDSKTVAKEVDRTDKNAPKDTKDTKQSKQDNIVHQDLKDTKETKPDKQTK